MNINDSGPSGEGSTSFGATIIQGLIEFRKALQRNDALTPRITCPVPRGAEVSDEEFERLLEHLAAEVSIPHPSNDCSRSDIYMDHD
jgi:hypothetical protein